MRRSTRWWRRCTTARLGVVVDIVPNHMTVPEPEHLNAPLWSMLREGRESAYAAWFDVDWDAAGDRIVIPVLGGTVDEALASGDLVSVADGGPDGDEAVVRYYDHELPVRPGTEDLPLAELLDRQWWRLESWRAGASTLNYRRFFDVGSLAAVRVEEPDVFDATHALVVDLVREGSVDGLRIDHPDGLADPRGYLRRLAEVTDDAWVVVEKILEGDERLPDDWPCAGTTGYDLLWRIGALFVDPAGEQPLTDQLAFVSGARLTLDEVVTASKQQVVATTLVPEVLRLARRADEVLTAPSSPGSPAVRLGRACPRGPARGDGPLPRLRRPWGGRPSGGPAGARRGGRARSRAPVRGGSPDPRPGVRPRPRTGG